MPSDSPDFRIAIVGMGGVFPSCADLDAFWALVRDGRDAAREPSPGRWLLPLDEAFDERPGQADRVYSRRGCFIDDEVLRAGAEADAAGLPAGFLDGLDPLFRIVLRAGRSAWSQCAAERIDRARTGVILGNIALPTEGANALAREWLGRTFEERVLGQAANDSPSRVHPLNRYVTGLPAGILARALGLGGGSLTLDAACASSLYAIKLACDELIAGRAEAMLAGGASRPDCLYTQMGFAQLRALSPSGRCAPFDAKGDGLVVGEGACVFVLKRLASALAHGDRILGVIHSVGLSNDVGGSLLAPHSEGQLRAMRDAYGKVRWPAEDIDLIECHATGTPVGDAVEFESLVRLWGEHLPGVERPVLGSVKSNVGHLLTGAGAAGLAKVLLAIREKTLPPTAHFELPGERIKLAESPFRILSEAQPWPEPERGTPRCAAVSSFGFGGINAHLIVEEWIGVERNARERQRGVSSTTTRGAGLPSPAALASSEFRPFPSEAEPIAIIGMDARFGPWRDLRAFQERVFGGDRKAQPQPPRRWWGIEHAGWFEREGLRRTPFAGWYVEDFEIPGELLKRLRIPPKELEEMLPQQSWMLLSAAAALQDARIEGDLGHRCGIFVGIGLDLNTTNFQLRWALPEMARRWNTERGLGLSEQETGAWERELREKIGPALNANRTMGALGGIVASRMAREFRCGGPCFTLSSEETSGLRALEMAVRRLQRHSLGLALVGAVDLAGDPRAVLGMHAGRAASRSGACRPFDFAADGFVPGEGAACVILKRLDDALKDGDRVYAVIRGLGAAGGGGADDLAPPAEAWQRARERALAEAGVGLESVGYLEAHGSGIPLEDQAEASALAGDPAEPGNGPCALGSVKADIGHTGAAAGLAGLVKAALCLYHEILPPLRGHPKPRKELAAAGRYRIPHAREYWLHDRAAVPRRAGVAGMSVDGTCVHALLEACDIVPADEKHLARLETERRQPLGARGEALFAVEAGDAAALAAGLRLLKERAADERPIEALARAWWKAQRKETPAKLAFALVARDREELLRLIARAERALASGRAEPLREERCAFAREPLGGKVAFVYPGSGNHFAGMGRELCVEWPAVPRNQMDECERLRAQLPPETWWRDALPESVHADARTLLIAQVALGTFVNDLLSGLGLKPDLAIGYSLGETAALFGLRAWTDRDEMYRRMRDSNLFSAELAGPCNAARRAWNLPAGEAAAWTVGILGVAAPKVRAYAGKHERVYLLIVNSSDECVIGGQRAAVLQAARELGGAFIELRGITVAHCPIVEQVADAYRELHLFETTPPAGVAFYSGAWAAPHPASRESCADSILAHALHGIDFPQVIEAAYKEGARVFVEIGPGGSCTRMIGRILGHRPHLARAACLPGSAEESTVLRLLAALIAERVPVDLAQLYGTPTLCVGHRTTKAPDSAALRIALGGEAFEPVPPPKPAPKPEPAPPVGTRTARTVAVRKEPPPAPVHMPPEPAAPAWMEAAAAGTANLAQLVAQAEAERVEAHEQYIRFSENLTRNMADNLRLQLGAFERLQAQSASRIAPAGIAPPPERFEPPQQPDAPPQVEANGTAQESKPFLGREACFEFARGKIGKVFGEGFAAIDAHPTRVRLPDEPLMLVDRVLEIDAEPRSMSRGRIVTEHDILADDWYLDQGRIPTCIAVESGQADLMLSGYLGIDFETRGLACYRLLDAAVTFHAPLPGAGKTIRYEIHVERFFRQGETWLFRFNFDASVDGRPLLTMRDGCAGFFTRKELDAGQGIVRRRLDEHPPPGRLPEDWRELAPLEGVERYDDEQLASLRRGDLAACFGPYFSNLKLRDALTLPGGAMKLLDRVLEFDPQGGRYGLGRIRAEASIRPDAWFLTCHFVDDMVMPGTLMYECCLHALRVFLLRMGWVCERKGAACEPIPGVTGRLKCRGQVVSDTQLAQYEVEIKEIGYGPEPYAIADAMMYADGRAIVEMTGLSLRLAGVTREQIETLWPKRKGRKAAPKSPPAPEPQTFERRHILAFATGKPSEAFGERYRVFDDDRRIARLPGPPYCFIDRIEPRHAQAWKLAAGGGAIAEYEIPRDEWYFASERTGRMPFAVLLEIALQPCGWLAAYMGSALSSETDLKFRNLGGQATQLLPVTVESGKLTTRVMMTKVSQSGGIVIQNFDLEIHSKAGLVYKGDTYFGFFTAKALSNQVGLRDAVTYEADESETQTGQEPFEYPGASPYPGEQLRMIDRIDLFLADGGPNRLGLIRGSLNVDPGAWFFKAHFFQDPVIPGSLGLESFLQLLKMVAVERWGGGPESSFESPALGVPHEWSYRGQVIPTNTRVSVEAVVTDADDARQMLRASGYLSVDGLPIYRMQNFGLRLL